jgi:hypothetical protein
MPEVHASFVEWVQASHEIRAVILQGSPELAAAIKTHTEKLEHYLAAVGAYQRKRNASVSMLGYGALRSLGTVCQRKD